MMIILNKKFIKKIFSFLHAVVVMKCILSSNHNQLFAMELQNSENCNANHLAQRLYEQAEKDKDFKTVILNILALTDAFVERTKHMLHYLKEIDKHTHSAIVPEAPQKKYPDISFVLPGEKKESIDFADVALKWKLSNEDPTTDFYYVSNEEKEKSKNTHKRLSSCILERSSHFSLQKIKGGVLFPKTIIGLQLFGKDVLHFFRDPNYIKVFNQQNLSPDTLMYFAKNKKDVEKGINPVQKEAGSVIENIIFSYFSLLNSFNQLLNFKDQIPLYNLAALDHYTDAQQRNVLNEMEILLKDNCINKNFFDQFIPLLGSYHSQTDDYFILNTLKTLDAEKCIPYKKVDDAIRLLGNVFPETIDRFDALHNMLFKLCLIMYQTRAVPTKLSAVVDKIEIQFNLALKEKSKDIDCLYDLYKKLNKEGQAQKYYRFWGPLILQSTLNLQPKIFDSHVSSATKKIELEEQDNAKKNAIRAKNAAKELLAEYQNAKHKHSKNNKTHIQPKNQNHKGSAQARVPKQSVSQKTTAGLNNVTNGKKTKLKNTETKISNAFIKEKVTPNTGELRPVSNLIEDAIILPSILDCTIKQECCSSLLFNKKYFQRLTDPAHKELHDHYHGLPAKMIAEIINTGFSVPSPKDTKATIYFAVAAVKTVIGKYIYHIPFVIQNEKNVIFHIGLHKEYNALKVIGNMATENISKLKKIIDFPAFPGVTENISNESVKNQEKVSALSDMLPSYAVSVPFEEFDAYFPCKEIIPSPYENTKTYSLQNGEQLIHLNIR
ncbi:hypothetical protein EKK58_04745 [Candidatus Dependentiae bacterium]|nr:MAG: hypothetical protein EKK58_04745 [Candidatus Dependentiae bacterium]